MATKMRARLQTPVDENGNRKDIALLTDVDSVMVDNDTTLHTYLDGLKTSISDNTTRIDNAGVMTISVLEPTNNGIWAEIKNPSKDDVDYTYLVAAGEVSTEWAKNWGARMIVADNADDYNSATMIKISELNAYDPDIDWEIGKYVYRWPKQ
jgi:hypothetical protein